MAPARRSAPVHLGTSAAAGTSARAGITELRHGLAKLRRGIANGTSAPAGEMSSAGTGAAIASAIGSGAPGHQCGRRRGSWH
eukprot:5918922-Alexandrium_andersonii.AAC.1